MGLSTVRAAVSAVAMGFAIPASAANITDVFSQLLIFGDSLSDSGDSLRAPGTAVTDDPGNALAFTTVAGFPYPPSPYFNGRFSNGPVWSDTLIAEFEAAGKAGRNYAFGGAQAVRTVDAPVDIPDFADQRAAFQFDVTVAPGPRPLAVVYFGGNDIVAAVNGLGGDVTATLASAQAAADEIGAQIRLFDTLTISDFAIVNTGDVGAAPQYSVPFVPAPGGPVANPLAPLRGLASLASQTFNSQLSLVAQDLRSTGRNITVVDVATPLAAILANPAANGLIDAVTPCGVPVGRDPLGLARNDFGQADAFGNGTGISPTGCITEPLAGLGGLPANVASYAWFDPIHPTGVIQDQLANTIRSSVAAAVPVPAPVAMLAGGLVLLAGIARRRA